jgi:hypothetical protein
VRFFLCYSFLFCDLELIENTLQVYGEPDCDGVYASGPEPDYVGHIQRTRGGTQHRKSLLAYFLRYAYPRSHSIFVPEYLPAFI